MSVTEKKSLIKLAPDAADPMLLAADELLVWRLYDWDLEEGVATGIFVFLADFHSSCCFNSFCKVSAALSRNGDGLFFHT